MLLYCASFIPFFIHTLSLCPGLQAEESLHSNSGTSVRDSGGHVEDDLGE